MSTHRFERHTGVVPAVTRRLTCGLALASLLCASLGAAPALAADAASAVPSKKTTPAQGAGKDLPTDEAANGEVDAGFRRWSSAWMFDRYVPGSARATERALTGETYVVRGVFDFLRSGTKLTIPFAAAYIRSSGRFALSNLCYNDASSGMTACIDPSANLDGQRAAAAQSRQFLGAIVLLGMVAAMSEEEETCVKRYTLFGEPYFECE